MSTFLLEIGTEELPADFARQVAFQLESKALTDLAEHHISHGEIQCSSTPRRILLIVNELSDVSDDLIE